MLGLRGNIEIESLQEIFRDFHQSLGKIEVFGRDPKSEAKIYEANYYLHRFVSTV